ncbi:MAG: SpoIIE family protein phosphatase [Leptospiraceae bacterium]|nr:SpoIIE family protein phosphatase [Leptospiraceae bacterium]
MNFCKILFFILSTNIFAQEFFSLEKNTVYSLSNSRWEYSPDYDPISKKGIWLPYSIPGNLAHNFQKKPDSVWVKLKLKFSPEELRFPISIRLGMISDSDKVFWNHKLIGSNGEMNTSYPCAYDKIRIYDIPNHYLEQNELLIQIKPYFDEEYGIVQDRVEIGDTALIHSNFQKEEYKKLLLLVIYATVGFYFLFLFVRSGKEKEYLLFSSFTFTMVCYQFLRTQVKYDFNFDFVLLKKFEYISLTLALPLFCNFAFAISSSLDKEEDNIFKRYYIGLKNLNSLHGIIQLLNLIIALALWFYILNSNLKQFDFVNKNIIQPIFVVYCMIALYSLYLSVKRKNLESLFILSAVFTLVLAVFYDILSDRGYFYSERIFPKAFLVFVFTIAFTLANKFVRLKNEVEVLNTNLEKRVIDRTKELKQSLLEINELKLKQDADYFLTTLLLDPLCKNDNRSETVVIEFYFKQKKKFEYRNRVYEIGGDISIASNLMLENKKYTIFINADAMGKSMQGAGGALVVGVVFHTIIARSHTRSFKNISAEKWLKELFLELQKVMEAFSGCMYVSAVIGLIDDLTGIMYYVNAEHPYSVLYRRGIANFLEDQISVRKLGTVDNEVIFQIETIPLFSKDILIIGSDGRDDLYINDLDGTKIMNIDHDSFLERVEASKGNLEDLARRTEIYGELTDDFSLIKVEYLPSLVPQKKIEITNLLSNLYTEIPNDQKTYSLEDSVYFMKTLQKVLPNNETANYFLGLYYYRKREYRLATKHLSLYLYSKPDSIRILLLLSIVHRRNGNLKKSLEISEQIQIRKPEWKRNLENLHDIHLLLGNEQELKEVKDKLLMLS